MRTLFDSAAQAGKTDSKGRIDIPDAVGDIAVVFTCPYHRVAYSYAKN